MTRRTAIAAAAALAAAPSIAAAANEKKTGYIDAHSHIWSDDVKRWPLAKGQTADDLKPRTFTAEELMALVTPHGVDRVVLIQHSIYHFWDNSYLVDAASRRPAEFSVTGMVDDHQPHPDRLMRELLPKRVRAFRIASSIHGKAHWLDGPGMEAMWRCAAETGQSMACLINPEDIQGVDAMCRRHPQTPVVIDHFARVGVDGVVRAKDVDQLCALARNGRVKVKISAYYALGKKQPPYLDMAPMIRRLVDAYGVERLMWASDCPYQLQGENTYGASIDLIREKLDFLSAGDRDWLLRKTAEQTYFA